MMKLTAGAMNVDGIVTEPAAAALVRPYNPRLQMAPTSGPTPFARALVGVLFVIVVLVTLWVPFYNRIEPAWHGIPFFYWFQVSWILVADVATLLAYRLKL
jgi:hypothetical protein